MARERIAAAGLDEVIDTIGGDFRADDALPQGHDVILLSMILHDWDEATGRALLRKCWNALEPGGTVVICELLLNPERTGPPSATLMGMNMIVELEGARTTRKRSTSPGLLTPGSLSHTSCGSTRPEPTAPSSPPSDPHSRRRNTFSWQTGASSLPASGLSLPWA
jgi:hypothetical protein